MKHIFFSLLFLVLITTVSLGQKVKYKDLYVLLKAENYKDADPYLRTYLLAEPEDPNANYEMGKMLQSYLDEGDLLNGSSRLVEIADSALLYLKKSLSLTNEKFVKKNDDTYYSDFRRRDMRSGKFEVKFSDVQFDIEERITTIEKFKSDIDLLLNHFKKAQAFYKTVEDLYDSTVAKAPTLNHLYFTSTTDDVDVLRAMVTEYDSSLYQISFYFNLMKGMGKAAVEQSLEKTQIKDYPNSNDITTDFYAKVIEYLDYNSWAQKNIDIILRQIFPLKKRLVTYDERVKVLHDNVVRDSLDERGKVFQLATENVGRDLRDYDPNTLPAAIFNYRIAEINYHSAVNYWFKEVADTLDIGLKLEVVQGFGEQLVGINKLMLKLKEANNPEQLTMFNEFITARYTDNAGMNRFIDDQQESIEEDSAHLWSWVHDLYELDKVAHWNTDSISLVPGTTEENADTRYFTIEVDTLGERTIGFYAWRIDTDGLAMSFGVAPSSRLIDSLFVFPISETMLGSSRQASEFLVDTVGIGKRIWLLNSAEIQADDKYLLQAIMTDLTLGVVWTKEFRVETKPTKISYDTEQKVIVAMDEKDSQLLVIDENGEKVVAVNSPEEKEDPEN